MQISFSLLLSVQYDVSPQLNAIPVPALKFSSIYLTFLQALHSTFFSIIRTHQDPKKEICSPVFYKMYIKKWNMRNLTKTSSVQIQMLFQFSVFVSISLCLCVGKSQELNLRLKSESEKGLMAGAHLKKSKKWSCIIPHTFISLFGLRKSFTQTRLYKLQVLLNNRSVDSPWLFPLVPFQNSQCNTVDDFITLIIPERRLRIKCMECAVKVLRMRGMVN